MEGRLNKLLIEKINSLNIQEPYVWKLRLTEDNFIELEDWVKDTCNTEGVQTLSNTKCALTTLVYLAEWYKRKYKGGNKNTIIDKINIEELWNNSGISQKAYLYKDDNGSKRWQYSIYVLGGLAIEHELGRDDNMKFLKGLCRLYHGENYTLENLDEASRAISFRESIKRKQSLYEYLKEILNGEMPFADEDLSNEYSSVNRFVAIVKAANDEILKVKFRFEWMVNFSPEYTNMSRKLNVWLKPEEVGGEQHQYLRYDRLHLWGIANPKEKHHLYVYIRFRHGKNIIESSSMERPIMTFLNHGVNDFVAVGTERCATVKNLPAVRFDMIEIVVKDEEGNEYIAQQQSTSEFLQLWRTEPYSDTWTSIQNTQRETAVIFTNRCKLIDESVTCDIIQKSFSDKKFGISSLWNWFYIYDSVGIKDDKGKEWRLYNRIGYDQVTTRLYNDTIHYVNGGKIRHYYLDDPDYDTDLEIEELPLIFGHDDIIIRHFATKDDILNAKPESNIDAEYIEWKQESGRYKEWTSVDAPPYGTLTLRVTIKGKPFILTAIYLPRLDNSKVIERDFDNTRVIYRDISNDEIIIQDNIIKDYQVLESTLPIRYGQEDDYFEIDVFRPTLVKEILLDNKIIEYIESEETIELPYILKNRVHINDFSNRGYQSYDCKELASIYTNDFLSISKNANAGWAALAAWNKDSKFSGKLFDSNAPECIIVCFGQAKNDSRWDEKNTLVWNYDRYENPSPCNASNVPDFGIIFQDLSQIEDLSCNFPIQVDDDVWGFEDVDTSIVKCFEVANEKGTYFFLMKPLIELSKSNIVKDLYKPLLLLRENNLTPKDKEGLLRFSEEFAFDWKEFNIIIEIE